MSRGGGPPRGTSASAGVAAVGSAPLIALPGVDDPWLGTGFVPEPSARSEQTDAVPMIWTRWQTAADERVCPECGPLHGLAWPEMEGPRPPLHVNCRCARVFAFVEWRAARG